MSSKRKKNTRSTKDREQLLSKFDNLHKKVKKDRSTLPRQSNTPKLVAVAVIVVIGMGGIYALTQFHTSPSSTPPPPPPVKTAVKLAGNYYNDTSVTPVFTNNKLTIVYVGGEFCPFCAMERWAIVMALQNYGNFTGLQTITSAEDHIPTYTFVGSTYTSSQIDFEPAEVSNNVYPNPSPLQSMNALQNQLFSKYSPQGYFPFISIGGSIYQVGGGVSLKANSFSGQTLSSVQSQVTAKSGSLYDQIQAEATLITTYINSMLSQQS